MGGRVEVNGCSLWLDSLIFRVGCGCSVQCEAGSVVGNGLNGDGENIGMQAVADIFAMDPDANLFGGFGMDFGSFAGETCLRYLPEIHLLFGAERSLRSDGAARGRSGHRIDLPGAWLKVAGPLRSVESERADNRHAEKHGGDFRDWHGVFSIADAAAGRRPFGDGLSSEDESYGYEA